MPGNQAVYQDSLRKAHNYAWDRKWPQAVAEYRRALAEFSTDPLVWTSLGAALLEAKRFVDAKEAYRQAADLTPEDVGVQQRLAEIYERLGDTENAADAQLQIATVLQRGPDPAQAVEAWRAILRMLPTHMNARLKLADLLEQLARPVEAAKENVALAKVLRDFGRDADSAERARKALALDPRNAEARALSGDASVIGAGGDIDADALQAAVAAGSEAGGPVFEATQRALARLADSVFEASTRSAGTKDGVGQWLAQATDLHVRGRADDAISAYQRALRAGHDTPDIHFALGILCLQTLRVEDAMREFNQTSATPGYDLASAFALAQCSRACHDEPAALGHVLDAFKLMDEEFVPPAQITTVENAYAALGREHSGSADPAPLTDVLTQYLSGPDWRARATDLRRRLDGASAPDEWIGLADVVSTRNAPRLIEALRASRDYQLQDKPTAAGEECFHALTVAPYFLPLHARLAEIFVQQRRIDDAIAKYMAMAAVQRARGDPATMANTLGRVLTYAPDNVEVRQSLIELLVARGAVADAIDQYLALGAVHMRLAQLDRAQKAYESALWMVPKAGVKDRWTLTALHMLGEIFVQRAAWKEALPVYLQIRKLAPDDDKASLRLIDLYFKLGRQPETENELAHLIRLYERRGDETKLIPMLGDMVAVRPRNSVLRNHLVDLLLRAGDKEQAIGELDALGELQLGGRQTRDAIQTIERIIALEPPNVESYRALLAQLQSGA